MDMQSEFDLTMAVEVYAPECLGRRWIGISDFHSYMAGEEYGAECLGRRWVVIWLLPRKLCRSSAVLSRPINIQSSDGMAGSDTAAVP